MFKDIEKIYLKKNKERKFNIYYWKIASIFIILSFFFKDYFNHHLLLILLEFILIIFRYFIKDYIKETKALDKSKNFKENILIYSNQIEKKRIEELIKSLKNNNFKTKYDIKIAIDYFNNKTVKIESNFLAWFVSAILTISSFIEIAYDSTTQNLDFTKISIILGSSLGIAILLSILIFIFNTIIKSAFFTKEKLHSDLSEDLIYIYINYEKYKKQLTKL